jgi:hypothetical protein
LGADLKSMGLIEGEIIHGHILSIRSCLRIVKKPYEKGLKIQTGALMEKDLENNA